MASACSEMSTGGTQAVVPPSRDSRLKKSASTGSFDRLRVVRNIPFASFQDGNHSRPHGLAARALRSEEHTSELQSQSNLVCRLLLEKKKTRSAISYPFTRILTA